MTFFQDLFKAIASCFKGFSLLFEKGLWPYLLYPLFVWLLMWIGSIWLFASIAEQVADYLNEQLNFDEIPDSGAALSFAKPFLTGYFSVIISWILRILFWLVKGTFVKYITLIFLSPLFALLSEAVEEKINGNKFPLNVSQLIKDIGRGIMMSLRNMLLEYLFIGLCFMITIVFPPLALITGPFLMLISWYFLGFTTLDYNFERHKMTISQSVKFTRQHMGLACGIGLVYSLFMILPLFIGLMFGPVLAVVGATISFLELQQPTTRTHEIL
ncbi:MAG: EI24 domain-containing protein [Bacteroidetes bacterium]|nr:EI24 domain-containing protein [Bacteroidota bacterium]